MVEVNDIYISKDGIMTSTSANHLANLAKECKETIIKELEQCSFVNSDIYLISKSDATTLNIGWKEDKLNRLSSKIKTLGELNSFCAWCREAIDYKKKMIDYWRNYNNLEEIAELNEIVIPTVVYPEHITEETVKNNWPIKKLNKYLYLESMAAIYGKYIHPNGVISKARSYAYSQANQGRIKSGSGRDTVIESFELSVNQENIESIYMQLQNEYRSYESQLNVLKTELNDEVNSRNAEMDRNYSDEIKRKNNIMDSIIAIQTNLINEKVREISKLKINLPEELKDIYNRLNSLGK